MEHYWDIVLDPIPQIAISVGVSSVEASVMTMIPYLWVESIKRFVTNVTLSRFLIRLPFLLVKGSIGFSGNMWYNLQASCIM